MSPVGVTAATKRYRVEEDELGIFLEECCELGDGLQIKSSVLYRKYKEWLDELNPPSQKAFGTAMTTKGFERVTNNGTWYKGLEMKGPTEG